MSKGVGGLNLLELVIATAIGAGLLLALSNFVRYLQETNYSTNLKIVRQGIIERFYAAINNPRVLFLSAGCPASSVDPCPTAPDAMLAAGTAALPSPCPTPANAYQSQLFACIGDTVQCTQSSPCPSASTSMPLYDPSFMQSTPTGNWGTYYYTRQGAPGSSTNYAFQVNVSFSAQVANSVSFSFTVTPNPSFRFLKGWGLWSSVPVSYSTPLLKSSPTNYSASVMNTANVSMLNGPDLCRNMNGVYDASQSLCQFSSQALLSTCPATGQTIIKDSLTNILYQCSAGVRNLIPVNYYQTINAICTVVGSFAINAADHNQVLVCATNYTWQTTD
jgi:hypothetical protein